MEQSRLILHEANGSSTWSYGGSQWSNGSSFLKPCRFILHGAIEAQPRAIDSPWSNRGPFFIELWRFSLEL
jgi:hypothetical protein